MSALFQIAMLLIVLWLLFRPVAIAGRWFHRLFGWRYRSAIRRVLRAGRRLVRQSILHLWNAFRRW